MTPLYQQTVVDRGDLRPNDTVVTIGMSNWNQISREVRFPEVNFVNAATGGATVGAWATGRNTWNGKQLWASVPNNSDIIWLNCVNRARAPLSDYISRATQDTFDVLDHIEQNYPNVREVWLTGLHGEPFAPANSKQPDEYAHASGIVADDVSMAANSYPFDVLHAAYIYAETTPRGDGLFWERSDFNPDMLHLSPSGAQKAAGLLEDYMADAINDDTPPPPPPPLA